MPFILNKRLIVGVIVHPEDLIREESSELEIEDFDAAFFGNLIE
jgi:hypothetical protein